MTAADGSGPVAILAGSGSLPILIADRLAAAGREVRILAFRGFADRALRKRADAVVGLLDIGRTVSCLDRWAPGCVTLAGGVNRPSPAAVIDAFSILRNRSDIAAVVAQGDDNLLRGVIELLEERGHNLVGVADLAPELLADTAVYGAVYPDERDLASIRTGFRLLRSLSPFDIGQAAVLRADHVLAIEGPEGTDRMLARASGVARSLLFRRRQAGGVMVKGPKQGQDLRIDLPAIGPRTIVNAARAGLTGVAVASGLTLVLDRARTVAEADRRGIFLVGIPIIQRDEP